MVGVHALVMSTNVPARRRARAVRTVTPSTVARLLEVKSDTVLRWIHAGDLPALNIGTGPNAKRFVIFRKDLIAFLAQRGLTHERVKDLVNF